MAAKIVTGIVFQASACPLAFPLLSFSPDERAFLLLCILLASLGQLFAETLAGRVVKVSDGDTITLLTAGNVQVKVRLEAIDAPEAGQEYGEKSRQALAGLVAGKQVQAQVTGTDRYGRSLAWITADGVKVNQRMIADGWAWHFKRYNSDPSLAALETEARAARRGLWAAPNAPLLPWEYRKVGARTGVPQAPGAPLLAPSMKEGMPKVCALNLIFP